MLISLKTEIARSVRGPKSQGPRAEDAMAEPYLVQKFLDSRSQGSQWKLWISKQSPICSRGAGLGHSMDPVVSVQNKNFTGNRKKLAKVLGNRQEAYSHLHWQFFGIRQSQWRSLGIIARLHHTDQKQQGLLKEQCAEWKKAPPLYCCNQVWMKIGAQTRWNATPICETFKISYLTRKLHMRERQWKRMHVKCQSRFSIYKKIWSRTMVI